MKTKILLFFGAFCSYAAGAQNVAINTTGTPAAATNMLEVTQTNAAYKAIFGINSAVAGTNAGYGILGVTYQDGSSGAGGGGIGGSNMHTNGIGVIGSGNALNTYIPAPGGVGAGGIFLGQRYGIYSVMYNDATSGTGYNHGSTYASILAYHAASTGQYNFAIHGASASAGATRVGGVIGTRPSGTTWASLGYYSSAPTSYGLYYTNATAGTGKYSAPPPVLGIGMGGYGGLLGAWIRGDMYGMNIKGERYSLYLDGKSYTNNIFAQLTNNGPNAKRGISYFSTSTTVDVQAKGIGVLIKGKAFVKFDENFSRMISSSAPIIITVTPQGKSNGVYIESSNPEGFSVVENNDGQSDVAFAWVAIATKKGYEEVQTPIELLAPDYDENMTQVMFNENDLAGKGMPFWWDGTKLLFDQPPLFLLTEKFTPVKTFKLQPEEGRK